MQETERLGSLLEMYNAAVAEMMSWNDRSVADLIMRLELWRTAAELELLFTDEREPITAQPTLDGGPAGA